MEYFNAWYSAMQKEQSKFNVNLSFNPSLVKEFNVNNSNFDAVYNRLFYMYRYATTHFYFYKECLTTFFDGTSEEILQCFSRSDLTMCSLTCGPALDYIALLLTSSECAKVCPIFESVNVLSMTPAWKHTAGFVLQAFEEKILMGTIPFNKDIKFIQSNFCTFDGRNEMVIKNSDIVLMFKTLNHTSPITTAEEASISSALRDLIAVLKPESFLFFIDTKPGTALITKELLKYSGRFLHEPSLVSSKVPEHFPEAFKDIYWCHPVLSARGVFFVWQKSPECQFLNKLSTSTSHSDAKNLEDKLKGLIYTCESDQSSKSSSASSLLKLNENKTNSEVQINNLELPTTSKEFNVKIPSGNSLGTESPTATLEVESTSDQNVKKLDSHCPSPNNPFFQRKEKNYIIDDPQSTTFETVECAEDIISPEQVKKVTTPQDFDPNHSPENNLEFSTTTSVKTDPYSIDISTDAWKSASIDEKSENYDSQNLVSSSKSDYFDLKENEDSLKSLIQNNLMPNNNNDKQSVPENGILLESVTQLQVRSISTENGTSDNHVSSQCQSAQSNVKYNSIQPLCEDFLEKNFSNRNISPTEFGSFEKVKTVPKTLTPAQSPENNPLFLTTVSRESTMHKYSDDIVDDSLKCESVKKKAGKQNVDSLNPSSSPEPTKSLGVAEIEGSLKKKRKRYNTKNPSNCTLSSATQPHVEKKSMQTNTNLIEAETVAIPNALKSLTDRINQLTASFENVLARENELNGSQNSSGSINQIRSSHHFSNSHICNCYPNASCCSASDKGCAHEMKNSCSKHIEMMPNDIPSKDEMGNNFCDYKTSSNRCGIEWNGSCAMHVTCHGCCANNLPKCCVHNVPKCFHESNFPMCCPQYSATRCCVPNNRLNCHLAHPSSESTISGTNIVIPVSRISDDLLFQLISSLKSEPK